MTLRSVLLGAAVLTAGVVFGAGSAAAAPVPAGSYQSTCNRVTVYGDMLRATCQTEEGDWIESRLNDYGACDGDIANDDGRLTCVAGDDNRGDGRDGRGDRHNDQSNEGVPPGSYQDTCRNERADDGDLSADCADRNGRVRHSELENYRRCHDDINNDNGVLRCGGNDDNGGYAVPTGTWRATCRDYRIERNMLYAECRDRRGRWNDTTVDLRDCRLGVSNVNGNLVCNVAAPVPVPLGWRISVYRNTGYLGTGRTFVGDVPDLANYGLANTISSAYLRSGAWQICTRPYYRGQCVTLRNSAPNLARLGINDRARSLRRVR